MKLTYMTHEQSVPVPGLTTMHPHRQASIDHLMAFGGYCTVSAGEFSVTKKANGHDLADMLENMSSHVQKQVSWAYKRRFDPPAPVLEKTSDKKTYKGKNAKSFSINPDLFGA